MAAGLNPVGVVEKDDLVKLAQRVSVVRWRGAAAQAAPSSIE